MGLGWNAVTAVGVVGVAGLLLAACGGSGSGGGDKVKRGEYLVMAGACADCHTPGVMLGKPEMDKLLGGGNVGFEMPQAGVFFPPNLTPDNETGLGKWSDADIAKAIRTGVRPDGRQLIPIMPYGWYSKLTEEDALAMAAYLKSLPPLSNKVPGPFGPNETPTGPYQTIVFPKAATAPADGTKPLSGDAPAAEPAPSEPTAPAPATPTP
jgi:mono/diheme cytochrome c family protein